MLDKIHVNQKTTYKGGSLVGMACNVPEEEATTVHTFMICSVLSGNKDVASMVPVVRLNVSYLKECTMKVIVMLESIGYLVLCLISDINRVNRHMFTDLCNGELKPYIEHPCCSTRKLFFLFDSVHLLKCVRNNWLGQADVENMLNFPKFSGDSDVLSQASFAHVRQLYDSEKDNIVKLAPSLTYKALLLSVKM